MPKYIDADALIHEYYKNPTYLNLCTAINNAPTADVVKVVRCKDCEHLVKSEGVCKVLSNNYEPPVCVEDDDFCSRGKRRDDE